MNRFNQILKTRRSVREFQTKRVTQKIANELIDMARWAPSAHNAQPWRFAILKNKELRNKLAREMGEAFKKDLEKDHVSPGVIQVKIQKSIERIVGAPLIILVCLNKEERNSFPDRRRNRLEEHMAHQGIGAAIQNILLGAQAMGLGACWFSAPLFCPRRVQRVLRIDTRLKPIALVLIGYPKESPKPPFRYGVKKVTLKLTG
jgi:coenzyme F420-0:L-glutamate ligase / coenzyme F420-1:gamma-L-glutamate ligase